jgi:hypothetical protein
MIENPTQEIIFMNVMTLMCELTGLRADAYYSVENQNKNDVPIMALNQNYTIVLNLTEKILKNLEKEALIEELINFLKSLNIKVSVKNYKKKITDIYSVDTLEKLFCFIYNYK